MQNEITEALKAARKRMRNCMGAIESDQVVDKDVHGSLKRGIADIDETLSAALAAADEQVPADGWVMVPVEPTREMWAAMADTLYGYKNRHHDKVAGDLYRAMLSARPTPPCDGRAEALEARRLALEVDNLRVPTCKEEFLGDDIKRIIEIAELNGKADALEDIANQHEEDAQEYNRLRDPGMANHHRRYARGYRDQAASIRALTQKDKADE